MKRPGSAAGRIYLVGSGIASLASAVYLIRDAGVPGERIEVLEQDDVAGGALDGRGNPEDGFVIRGGRMHERHFACYWDLLSGIPSATDPGKSVTEESFAFAERLPSRSRSRLVRDARVVDVSSYGLRLRDKLDIVRLTLTPESRLGSRRIEDWFGGEFFDTRFWQIWASMFAFQKWSSVAEMRRYFLRFMHLFPGLHELGGIMRTCYNQYDSVVVPLRNWLAQRGVRFRFGTRVVDIDFAPRGPGKAASAIHVEAGGKRETLELADRDYVFVTLGSLVESTDTGSMTRPAVEKPKESSGAWMLWERIAAKDPAFGKPGVFSDRIDLQKWVSFTVTMRAPGFLRHLSAAYGYVPGASGLMTIVDSSWLLSIVVAAQPHFSNQPAGVDVFWGYGLYQDRPGDFVKKRMQDCSGEEILAELFAHLKLSDAMRPAIEAGSIACRPTVMPFIDSAFMPRSPGDRPAVVPAGAANFAFLGQFVEVPDDCVFTVEYSVRTAQTAVCTLFDTGKRPLPVYVGGRKLRSLANAILAMNR
ncbi:oleate hydratase [Burkholderiaceae bacterium FT117]|uniref:oleate hydratase n=1 Tax=Zeimonas sediminis TaxID=2944268 RepID=UPI0023432423|nr:oleate hydratase [Zeimonas sediminis]MCM5569861.1 oleate hydratase [Zeimonas sediminis]